MRNVELSHTPRSMRTRPSPARRPVTAPHPLTLHRRLWWLCLVLTSLLIACQKEEAVRESQATAPPQEKVDCTQVMEWIRERPLSKRCETDADCTLQRDNCCDITAVNTSYAIQCERTCKETCPQDSTVGQSLAHSAVCRNHTCDVTLSATAEMPNKTTP